MNHVNYNEIAFEFGSWMHRKITPLHWCFPLPTDTDTELSRTLGPHGLGNGMLIFHLLASLQLSEMGQIWGFEAFPGERIGEWPEILYADESWPPSEFIKSLSWFVDSSNFGAIWTSLSETGQIWGVLVISQRTHGGIGLKFCMLMYPVHLQKWLDYGHGL